MRFQMDAEVMRTDRLPAVGDGVAAGTVLYGKGILRGSVYAHKGIAACVEGIGRTVCIEDSVVISSFSVFRLVIDGAAFNLHFTGGEVALEVCCIIRRIPQTEFHKGEQIEIFGSVSGCYADAVQQDVVVFRNEELLFCTDAVFRTGDDGVAQTVAAFICVQRCLYGLPSRVPYSISVFDIDVETILIQRQIVIPVAGDPAQFCIFIERITACGI